MQVRRVIAFTCNVAKVSINHELIHKRSQTKELNDFYKQHKIVYYLLLELKLTLFYSAYYKHCTKFNVLTTCILADPTQTTTTELMVTADSASKCW